MIRNTGVNLNLREGTSDEAVFREVWRENVYRVFGHDLEGSGVAIDLGANIGAFSLYAAHFRPANRVFAYEPEPDNYAELLGNMERNGATNVHPRRLAVSSSAGTARLDPGFGHSHLHPEGRVEVETITLEDVFARDGIEECDVLKIDVEGAEYDLVPAAPVETLRRIRYLTMETHATTPERFGALLAHLSLAFNTHFFGSYLTGGMVYGRRY